MTFAFQADWPLDDAARAWLPVHVRGVFVQVAETINEVLYVAGVSPVDWWNTLDVELTVRLHDGACMDHEGVLRSGIYWPAENMIDTDWKLEEREPWRETLKHEMQHFFGEQLPGFNWAAFGHGHSDDPYIQVTKRQLDRVYHGDVTLRHKDVEGPL